LQEQLVFHCLEATERAVDLKDPFEFVLLLRRFVFNIDCCRIERRTHHSMSQSKTPRTGREQSASYAFLEMFVYKRCCFSFEVEKESDSYRGLVGVGIGISQWTLSVVILTLLYSSKT
jgi:hypothetical protein